MSPDFDALRDQLIRLIDVASTIPVEERELSAHELIDVALRPQSEKLSDPRYGVGLAAREVGQAVVNLAGFTALHRLFDDIEAVAGEDAAEWVSRRWTGISDKRGSVWSD